MFRIVAFSLQQPSSLTLDFLLFSASLRPDGVDFDAPVKTGRAFGVMGSILGLALFIMYAMASPRVFFGIMGNGTILMALFTLILLVGLQGFRDADPELAGAGHCIFPSAFCWGAAGVTTLFSMEERVAPVEAVDEAVDPEVPKS